MKAENRITRRQMLGWCTMAGMTGVMAACTPAGSPAVPTQAAQPTAAPEATVAQAQPTAAPAPAEPVKLRALLEEGGEGLDLHKNAIKAFTDANPGIEVEVTATTESYYTKLQTEAAAGAMADMVQIGEAYTPHWAKTKVVADLEPYIEAEANFARDDFFPNVLDPFQWEGRQHALPKDYVTWCLFYNKDLFDAAGVPYPDDSWTWDPETGGKYLEVARALTVTEGTRTTQYGMVLSTHWGYYFPRIWDNGGRYLNAERTQCLLASPEAIQAVQWMSDLVNKYSVAPTSEGEEAGFGFGSGKVAMMAQGSYMIPGLLDAEFDWGVSHHPSGPKGRHSIMFSGAYALASTSKHPEEAWKMIVFMTREGSEILAQAGWSVPARQSIAAKPGFLNERTIPHNAQLFLDAAAYMGMQELTETWIQEEQIIAEQITLIMAGERTAEEGLKAAAPKIDDLLKSG